MASTSYEMNGTVKRVMDQQTLAKGFTKRDFVLKTDEDYPQEVPFECIKDRCSLLDGVKEGDRVNVSFNIRGREYNGRYFVNLQAWRIRKAEESGEAKPTADSDLEPVDHVDEAGADGEIPF